MADQKHEDMKEIVLDDDEKRRNLLDVAKVNSGKVVQFRMVLIARINEEHQGQANSAVMQNFFEDLLQNAQGHSSPLTGLLLLYPVQSISVIEGAYESMQFILRFFAKAQNFSGYVSKVKLLVLSANVDRHYRSFNKKVMNLVAPRVEGDYSSSEPFEVLVGEVLSQLSIIGRHLSGISQMAAAKELESIQEKKPEAIVSQDLLGYLLNLKEIPSPEEYLNFYNKTRRIILDENTVWPIRARLLDQVEQ